PQIPLISTVTGKLADLAIATPAYWVNHVQQPVQFAAAMYLRSQLSLTLGLRGVIMRQVDL
ncbi:MAG: hypothetical protein F6K04_25645, partial [Leptolyngbya sp. SIO4C5]|nr:hypothetical protein [Leptolyngbya sp. SIO4C5]